MCLWNVTSLFSKSPRGRPVCMGAERCVGGGDVYGGGFNRFHVQSYSEIYNHIQPQALLHNSGCIMKTSHTVSKCYQTCMYDIATHRASILDDPLPQMKHVFLSTSSLWSFSALRAAKVSMMTPKMRFWMIITMTMKKKVRSKAVRR